MSVEQNKRVEERYKEAVWDKHDQSAIDEFVDPEFVHHNPALGQNAGREGLRQTLAALFSAFPDVNLTHEHLIAEGDMVVEHWTARGTHRGPLMGIAPTNRAVTIAGVDIYRYKGGKRVEAWTYWDVQSFMNQLGVASSGRPGVR